MTLRADSGMQAVSTDDIVVIAQDVWASFLDMHLEPVLDGPPPAHPGPIRSGVVEVVDTWTGFVVLECTDEGAGAMAAAMFRDDAARGHPFDVADVLGELTNMIGGNVKSLLPAPSRLSLPVVRPGAWRPESASAVLVNRVDFVAGPGGDPLSISIWQV